MPLKSDQSSSENKRMTKAISRQRSAAAEFTAAAPVLLTPRRCIGASNPVFASPQVKLSLTGLNWTAMVSYYDTACASAHSLFKVTLLRRHIPSPGCSSTCTGPTSYHPVPPGLHAASAGGRDEPREAKMCSRMARAGVSKSL